mgnify:CR=1 FL=1
MQCFYKNVIYISIHSFRKLDLQRITNHEIYTILCKAFAQDDSGGEYVFLNDGNIGFISSEGEIGRIAESLKDLLILLIHIGNIFDFNCKWMYQNQELLKSYCDGYLLKIRARYKDEGKDWDTIRADIARERLLSFNPNQLYDFAISFYKSATRTPKFSCRYLSGEEEYIYDSVITDVVSIWVTELTGMTIQETEKEG